MQFILFVRINYKEKARLGNAVGPLKSKGQFYAFKKVSRSDPQPEQSSPTHCRTTTIL